MKQKNGKIIRVIVGCAVFSALAFLETLVLPIKIGGFLTLDFKDSVIVLAAFLYGPLAAVGCSLVASLLELVTISTTGLYGFLMNFVSSVAFSLVASVVYRFLRTRVGAVLSLLAGTVTMTASMLLLNLWITPIYMGVSAEDVVKMIPTLLLPFNVAKGFLNSAVATLLYKPAARAFRAAKLAGAGKFETDEKTRGKSLLLTLALTAFFVAIGFTILFVFIK